MSSRSRSPGLTFLTWFAALAAILLCGGFYMDKIINGPTAYLSIYLAAGLLALVAVAVVVALIIALVSGLASGTAMVSLAGALAGTAVGFLGALMLAAPPSYEETRRQAGLERLEAEKDRAREFLPFAEATGNGDRDAIREAVEAFNAMPLTDAVCLLTKEYVRADPYDPYFPGLKEDTERPFSSERPMLVADVIAESGVPLETKQHALYTVLEMLERREGVAVFGPWIRIWKKAHAPRELQYLEVEPDPHAPFSSCPAPETAYFASAIGSWGNDAIHVWMDNGLLFAPSQHRRVLYNVADAATLAAAIRSGVNPNPEEEGSAPVIFGFVESLGRRFEDARRPEDVADLLDEFTRVGTEIRTARANGETVCPHFRVYKPYLGVFPERANALTRIENVLCGEDETPDGEERTT